MAPSASAMPAVPRDSGRSLSTLFLQPQGTGVDLRAGSLRLTACEHGRVLNSLNVKHLVWFLSSRRL